MRDTVHFDHYWSLCSWFWKNMIQNFHYMGFAQRDCLQEDKLQYRISGIYVLCFFSSVKSKIFVSSIILALGFNLFQLKPIGIFINNCHWNKFLLINLESNCFAVVCVINIAVLYIYIIYIIIWCVCVTSWRGAHSLNTAVNTTGAFCRGAASGAPMHPVSSGLVCIFLSAIHFLPSSLES